MHLAERHSPNLVANAAAPARVELNVGMAETHHLAYRESVLEGAEKMPFTTL